MVDHGVFNCCKCGSTSKKNSPIQKYCASCREQVKAEQAAKARAAYTERNRERLREKHAQWVKENPEVMREALRQYREKNRELLRSKDKAYRDRTREHQRRRSAEYRKTEKFKEIARECQRKRRANPMLALSGRVSRMIRASLSSGAKARRSWEDLVGYSLSDLVIHIERQFAPGMSWENRDEWHIDHIVPVSAFSFESPEDPDFKACWALTNLRPLWAADNLRKNATRETLL